MSCMLESLKSELIDLILSMGAVGARVANLKMLEGPPSADPTYVLPEAQSVIAFAVPLGKDFIPDYLGKVTRLTFSRIMYEKYQLIGVIGQKMVEYLQHRGFRAVSPQPNGIYRPTNPGSGSLAPDFSHRYAALASGLGTLGWSGNVLIKGHWATTFLGSVITDAMLPSDAPLQERLCDDCKICTKVCPLGFIHPKEPQTVILGGREYVCSKRGNHLRCGLACGGYVGISRDGKWSSWATLRYKVPEDDSKLLDIFTRAVQDPASKYIRRHLFYGGQGVLARSIEDTNPTCCHCVLVCSGPRKEREKLLKKLHSSGIVVRLEDGTEKAVKPEELENIFTE
ncbi:MAG: hypothetical protein WED07_10060 [Candidatus Freyarchaeum deiterrae]